MILQDNIHNTEIVYLYTHKFEYGNNPISKEENGGHPKPKTVYRAIYNTDTNTYRLIYNISKEGLSFIFIPKLKDHDEESGLSVDIKILTKKNILDFNISEENLDELLSWLKTDNKDIKEITGDIGTPKPKQQKVKQGDKPAVVPQNKGVKLPPQVVQFLNLGIELEKTDPLIFGTMFDLLVYLNQNVYTDIGVVNASWLKLDKDHGAGTNISSAVEKLARYMSQDRRTNLDGKDLLGAIKDLLQEQGRRTYHEID